MEKVGKLVVSVLSVVIMWVLYLLWLPPLSIAYASGFLFIGICLVTLIANIAMWVSDFGVAAIIEVVGVVIVIVVLGLGGIAGSRAFNAMTKQQQIGEVEEVEFNEMIKQIDTSQIPIVDEALANKQADKKIGEDIALGSRIKLGDAAIQEVNGEIMFVVPLEHTSFWKWNKNRATPGYITVSASNPNKVNFVTELDGEKINIRYQESAYFSKDLKRHMRNEGFRNVGLTEYTFEIDDSGRPYWVVTTFENHTIFSAEEATGVVIVDAQTGETNWYSIEDTPEWVDIIQPKSFIEDQIDNWGELIHGFWNTMFGNTEMTKKTDLTLTVYVNGDCYYFTGMTSVGTDESCSGFIMVNTRNKHAQICHISGATENAAMKSAEGLVSDFGYKSTEPFPININGIATYAHGLKDEEGLLKAFAFVNVENYSIAAKGASLAEASRAYIQSVARNSSTQVVASDEAYGYTYEGKVQRISNVVEDGSTYYYLVVEGEEGKIFTASYMVSEELAVTRDGDTVQITYVDDKNGTVDIITFDNIQFATPVSEAQEKRNELDKGTSAYDADVNQIIEVNPDVTEDTWNSLSDEEKAKMLQEYQNNN